jgi:hypothetical protein
MEYGERSLNEDCVGGNMSSADNFVITTPKYRAQQYFTWFATLPGALVVQIDALPPGINSQYGVGRGRARDVSYLTESDDRKPRVYLTPEAEKWAAQAALVIGAKSGETGWRQEFASYGLLTAFSGTTMDVDAPVRLVIDTVARKLGFDDRLIVEQASIRIKHEKKSLLIVLYPCEELCSWVLPHKE